MTSLLDLPQELIERVLLFLSKTELLALKYVNSTLNVILKSPAVEYRIHLEVMDMIDGDDLSLCEVKSLTTTTSEHLPHSKDPVTSGSNVRDDAKTHNRVNASTTKPSTTGLSTKVKLRLLKARRRAFMNLQWRDGDDEDGEEKGGEAELHKNQSCGRDGDIRDDRVGDQLFSSSTGTYSPYSTPSTSSSSFNNVPQPTATHLPLQAPIENEQAVEKGLHKFIMNGETSIYECQDGIFLYTDGYKDVMRGRRIPSSIRLIPLPTADKEFAKINVPTHSRDVGLTGGIADLTLDPTQDLLIVAEMDPPEEHGVPRPMHRYHILTLSTLRPHPLASRPVLSTFLPYELAITSQLIQVLGDVIAVLVSPFHEALGLQTEEVIVWNWKTGMVLSRLTIEQSLAPSCLVLLSPRHFLLTIDTEGHGTANPVIEVYVINRDPTVTQQVLKGENTDTAGLEAASPHTLAPSLLAAFRLPPFAARTELGTLTVRPDPPSPPVGLATPFSGPKPFVEDYRQGILVFEFRALAFNHEFDAQVASFRATMFASKAMFLEKAIEQDAKVKRQEMMEPMVNGWEDPFSTEARHVRQLRWQDWGEENTRIIADQTTTSRSWVVNSSAWRFITTLRGKPSRPNDDPHIPARLGPHHLQLLDFSPTSIRQHRLDHPEVSTSHSPDGLLPIRTETPSGNIIILRDKPTRITNKRIFKDDVVTRLPYLETTTKRMWECDGVMMDEQRVMLTKAQISAGGELEQEVTVLTF